MNEEYLQAAIDKAKETAAELGEEFDIRLFISGVSKRANQLASGYQYLIPRRPDEKPSYLDDALREVAAGRVIIRRGVSAVAAAEDNKKDQGQAVEDTDSSSIEIPMVD